MLRGLPLVLLLLLLAPRPARPAPADELDRARFAGLLSEYRGIEKSRVWDDVKRRRDLLAEIGLLSVPHATQVLYSAFVEEPEPICRLAAMDGLARRGDRRALTRVIQASIRERNDVYLMHLPEALAGCPDETLGDWLVKNLLPRGAVSGKGRDLLRPAVVEALGVLKAREAYEPIRDLLKGDGTGVRSRYESLIALARIAGTRAVPTIGPHLADEDARLRAAAVIALEETGSEDVVEMALPLADDPDPRVREAVAELIGARKASGGIPTLIRLLGCGRLRVMDTSRRILEEMTGEAFGFDAGAFRRWFENRGKENGDPPPPDPAAGSVPTYHGLRVYSDRVLFLLDISGSMTAGDPPRIETAREELSRTVDQLSGKTRFNVVAFGGSPRWWRDESTVADPRHRESARDFVRDLSPGGGTNVYDTLVEAFEKAPETDTMYFLGDGCPSSGRVTGKEEILIRVRWMNRMRHVRIHTVALLRGRAGGSREDDEEEAARFLSRLAAVTDGTFLLVTD